MNRVIPKRSVLALALALALVLGSCSRVRRHRSGGRADRHSRAEPRARGRARPLQHGRHLGACLDRERVGRADSGADNRQGRRPQDDQERCVGEKRRRRQRRGDARTGLRGDRHRHPVRADAPVLGQVERRLGLDRGPRQADQPQGQERRAQGQGPQPGRLERGGRAHAQQVRRRAHASLRQSGPRLHRRASRRWWSRRRSRPSSRR